MKGAASREHGLASSDVAHTSFQPFYAYCIVKMKARSSSIYVRLGLARGVWGGVCGRGASEMWELTEYFLAAVHLVSFLSFSPLLLEGRTAQSWPQWRPTADSIALQLQMSCRENAAWQSSVSHTLAWILSKTITVCVISPYLIRRLVATQR